jgi:hypothetical protein
MCLGVGDRLTMKTRSVKQWAAYIDKTLNNTESCPKCVPGASCIRHSESFWKGIDGLRKAVRSEEAPHREKSSQNTELIQLLGLLRDDYDIAVFKGSKIAQLYVDRINRAIEKLLND